MHLARVYHVDGYFAGNNLCASLFSVDLLLACVHEYVHAGAEYEVAVVAEGQCAIGTCIGRATLCTLPEISRVG